MNGVIKILVIVCLFTGLRASAQYQNAYGLVGLEEGNGNAAEIQKVIPDINGGHVVVGFFQDYDAFNVYRYYIALFKINADGTLAWTRKFECYDYVGSVRNTNPIKGLAIAQSPDISDKGFVIVGTFDAGGNTKNFILKTDENGEYPGNMNNTWAHELYQVHNPAVGVCYDTDGNIVVYSRADVRNHDLQLTWVRFDAGSVIQKFAYGTQDYGEMPIAMCAAGDYIYMVGQQDEKIIVEKIESTTGVQAASNIIEQTPYENVKLVPTDIKCEPGNEGGLFISGYFDDAGKKTPVALSLDESNLSVLKFVEFDVSNIGLGEGVSTGLALGFDDDFVVFSGFYQKSTTTTGSMLIATDYSLNPLTNGLVDLSPPGLTVTTDYLSCITVFENNYALGDYFLAGNLVGTTAKENLYACRGDIGFNFSCESHLDTKGTEVEYDEGSADALTSTYGDLEEINLEQKDPELETIRTCSLLKKEPASFDDLPTNTLLAFPVPAKDLLTLQLADGSYDLLITNLIGQEVMQQKIVVSHGKVKLDVTPLNEGVYFLRLYGKGENFISKVTVQR